MSEDPSYDPAMFDDLARAEESHFWFRSRQRIIGALLRKYIPKTEGRLRVLEVGCGTGYILSIIERSAPLATVVGMDFYAEGFDVSQKRTAYASLVQADVFAAPFSSAFDVVGLFDVLEHFSEDVQILGEIRNMLKSSGRLLITVPAHPSLWSYSDEVAHHRRRYVERDLVGKLKEARYSVEYVSPYLSLMLPIAWLRRKILRGRESSGRISKQRQVELFRKELRIVPGLNWILRTLLELEVLPIAYGNRIPFGSSLIVVAKKMD